MTYSAQHAARPRPAPNPRREQTITRLAVLKAAVEFASARPELKSADVIRLAEAFERWATR